MPNRPYEPRDPAPCSKGRADHVTSHGHPACRGHKTAARGGACCRKEPSTGQDVCAYHGGAAPQNRAAGAQRAAEAEAVKVLRRFGEPLDTTPTEALLDAVKWTAGYVAWLRDKVATADEDRALTQRSTVSGKREPSVWLDLLGTWHDRLVRICTEAIKAGIEERRVRIAEQQGALVADVIRKILADLDLTTEQAQKAGQVVPARLRALAAVS